MSRYICPDCGAHLDPGERCDCAEKETAPAGKTPEAAKQETLLADSIPSASKKVKHRAAVRVPYNLAELNAIARAYGMSYGKFTAALRHGQHLPRRKRIAWPEGSAHVGEPFDRSLVWFWVDNPAPKGGGKK